MEQILKDFNKIPYYIIYNNKTPTNEEINFIEKISILKIMYNHYKTVETDYSVIKKKYFILMKSKKLKLIQ